MFRGHKEDMNAKFFVPRGGGFGGADIAGVAFSMRFGGLADCCHCFANQIIRHCRVAHADRKIRGTREKRINAINCGNLIR